MKIAYIAHPVGAPTREEMKKNLDRITNIVRLINLSEPEVVPFVPYLADCVAMDDNTPSERARGIKNDIELIKRGFIDEIRLYGSRISKGMLAEIELARELDISVVPMTEETKTEYEKLKTE